MKSIAFIILPVIFLFAACEKKEPEMILRCGTGSPECGQIIVVSDTLYANGPADHLDIYETEIQGNCLRIKFGSSGCSGESWNVKLVASEALVKTLPPQRYVRLSLENNELCEAYIMREMRFNLNPVRSSGNKVQLNITNADTSLMYEY